MGAFLDKPKTEKHHESGSGNDLRFAICAMQGWRIEMEDTHVALTELGAPFDKWSFFGVFDGHAGAKVSKLCAEHLLGYVIDTDEIKQLKDDSLSADQKSNLIKQGLIRGFLNLDEHIRKTNDVQTGEEDRSGSTAICALITSDTIYLANCGDSRAVLVSKQSVALATQDHKPANPSETQRITNAGGYVMVQRVNGSLAVSRALGDFEYKRTSGLRPSEQMVSPEPEISNWVRAPSDEFIVLACDGVWDVMSNEEVCRYVRYQLTIKDDLEAICEGLADTCLNKGSRDNISVVLILFPGAPQLSEEARQRDESLNRSIDAAIKDIFEKHPADDSDDLDVAQISDMVGRKLKDMGVTFPPNGGVDAEHLIIEKVWNKIRSSQQLDEEPTQPLGGFHRPPSYEDGELRKDVTNQAPPAGSSATQAE